MSSIPSPVANPLSSGNRAKQPVVDGPQVTTDDLRASLHVHLKKTASFIKFMDALVLLSIWACGILGLWLVACAIDHWLVPLPSLGRWAFWSVGVAGSAWWIGLQFVPLILRRINPVYAAKRIEQLVPEFKNGLISWLELESMPQHGVPRGVMSALTYRAARFIGGQDPSATVDTSPLIKLIGCVLLLTTGLVLYTMLSPKSVFVTGQRILMPWKELAAPTRVHILDVKPGALELTQGKPLAIEAEIRGLRSDEIASVRFTTLDGQIQNQRRELAPSTAGLRYGGQVVTASGGVQQPLDYWIEAGDAVSGPHRVSLSPLPSVVLKSVELLFPAYTRLPPRTVAGDKVEAVEGTRATIRAQANQNMKRGRIEVNPTLNDADELIKAEAIQEMATDQRALEAEWLMQLNSAHDNPTRLQYRIRGYNARGDANPRPIIHSLSVLADAAPDVTLVGPENRVLRVRPDARVNLEVRAADPDFGLTELNLSVARNNVAGPVMKLLQGEAVLGRQVKTWQVDLSEWRAKVGDVFQIRATALDNRHDPLTQRPASNSTESQPLILHVVGPEEKTDVTQNPPKQANTTEVPKPNPTAGDARASNPNSPNAGSSTPPANGSSTSNPPEKNRPQSENQTQSENQSQPNDPTQDSQQPSSTNDEGSSDGNSGAKNSEQQSGGQKGGGQQSGDESGEGQPSDDGAQQGGSSGSSGGSSEKGGSEKGESGKSGNGNSKRAGDDSQSNSQKNGGSNAGNAQSGGNTSAPSGGAGSADAGTGGSPSSQNSPNSKAGKPDTDRETFERVSDYLDAQSDQNSGSSPNPASQSAAEQPSENSGSPSSQNASDGDPTNNSESGNSESGKSEAGKSEAGKSEAGKSEAGNSEAGNSEFGKSEPGKSESGNSEPGKSEPGKSESGKSESGKSESGNSEPGNSEPGNSEPGKSEPGKAESGDSESAKSESGKSESGKSESGKSEAGKSESGNSESGKSESGKSESGKSESGKSESGKSESGKSESGNSESGNSESGKSESGKSESGKSEPGKSEAGNSESGKSESGKSESGKSPATDSPNAKSGQDTEPKGNDSQGSPSQGAPPQGSPSPSSSSSKQGEKSSGNGSQPSDQPNGSGTGTVGGQGGATGTRDETNRDFADQTTQMVLDYLNRQKDQPDPELLRELDWSPNDLNQFVDRWNKARDLGNSADPQDRLKWREILENLNLSSADQRVRQGSNLNDSFQQMQDGGNRMRAPESLRKQYDAYLKALERAR